MLYLENFFVFLLAENEENYKSNVVSLLLCYKYYDWLPYLLNILT